MPDTSDPFALSSQAHYGGTGGDRLRALVEQASREWQTCIDKGLTLYGDRAYLFAERKREEAYLDALLRAYEDDARRYAPLSAIREPAAPSKGGGEPPVLTLDGAALKTFADERRPLLVSGGAGAGKTAVLRRLAYEYALAARKNPKAPLPLYADLEEWDGGRLYDRLAGCFRAAGDAQGEVIDLGPHLAAYLNHGRVVLLLDGLDGRSLGDGDGKSHEQEALKLRSAFPRVPLAAAAARRAEAAAELGPETVRLRRLSLAEQTAFAQAYLGEAAGHALLKTLAGGEADLRWAQSSGERRRLLGPAAAPAVLKLLIDVSRDREMAKRLTASMGLLLQENVVGPLWARESRRLGSGAPSSDAVFDALADLALRLRERALGSADAGSPPAPEPKPAAALLAAAGAGLVESAPDGGGSADAGLRFSDPLFEEFFAAHAVRRTFAAGRSLKEYWPDGPLTPSGWEQAAVLLAGVLPDMTDFVTALIPVNPAAAAQCIGASGGRWGVGADADTRRQGAARLTRTALLRTAEDRSLPHPVRCAAGDALNFVGDGRTGVGLRDDDAPDIAWRLVEAKDGGGFAVALYPVTNVQFDAFYRDGGYETDDYWSEDGCHWREAGGVTGPKRLHGESGLDNHPAAGVCWYEAQAFCAWLSVRLGVSVTLPTGAQWEQAAGAEDGRSYPHGGGLTPEHANYRETGLGKTSAVGVFPLGESPCGLMDMAGNVREWAADGVDEGRGGAFVLRGGSFFDSATGLTCAHVYHSAPHWRDERIGFRLATSDPAVLRLLRSGAAGGV